MPESCKDRPTKSHEYILMLTKSPHYFWDMEAVREPYQPSSIERMNYPTNAFGTTEWGVPLSKTNVSTHIKVEINPTGRNLRSVWEFSTGQSELSHFAVFPTELPKRCILAGTSEKGCCPKCGKPWVRIIEKEPANLEWKRECGSDKLGEYHGVGKDNGLTRTPREIKQNILAHMASKQTIGWKPSCRCGIETTNPCTVLDPFAGTGTTLAVAKGLGRKAIGIDISEEYCKMAIERVAANTLPLRLD